jgi:hypothetical protein
MLLDDSTGGITRELWCMSQEFSPTGIIISPWFSMLIYDLRDEQLAHWWPQFRDIVSLPST